MNILKKIKNFFKRKEKQTTYGNIPIGQTFVFDNVKYEVISDEGIPVLEVCCHYCSMRNLTSCSSMHCMSSERRDHKNAHFEEVHDNINS